MPTPVETQITSNATMDSWISGLASVDPVTNDEIHRGIINGAVTIDTAAKTIPNRPSDVGAGQIIELVGDALYNPYGVQGTHDGSSDVATLSDSTASWTTSEHVGQWVINVTDGSRGIITANDGTTVTATLAGGTDNDWDASDAYAISTGAVLNAVDVPLAVDGTDVRLAGFGIIRTGTGNGDVINVTANALDGVFEQLYVGAAYTGTNGNNWGIDFFGGGAGTVVRNTVVERPTTAGASGAAGGIRANFNDIEIRHCTVVNSRVDGIRYGAVTGAVVDHCIVLLSGTEDIDLALPTTPACNYCLTEDTTGDDYGGTGNLANQTATEVVLGTTVSNFRMEGTTPSPAWLAGIDRSASGITVDFEGNPRNAHGFGHSMGAYDVGYSETAITTGAELATWETDTDNDLISANTIERAEIQGQITLTGALFLAGATADALRYREIRAQTRYDPVTATGSSIIQNQQLRPGEVGFRVGGGLGLLRTDTTTNALMQLDAGASGCIFDGIYGYFNSSATGNTAYAFSDLGSGGGNAWQNIIVDRDAALITTQGTTTGFENRTAGNTYLNCIVYNAEDGIGFSNHANSSNYVVENCIATDCSTDFFWNGTGGSHNYNASSDSTADGAQSLTTQTAAATWRSTSAHDFHLLRTSSGYGGGTTQTGYTLDYRGRAHGIGGTWDMGAYDMGAHPDDGIHLVDAQLVAAGGSTAALTITNFDSGVGTGRVMVVVAMLQGGGDPTVSGVTFNASGTGWAEQFALEQDVPTGNATNMDSWFVVDHATTGQADLVFTYTAVRTNWVIIAASFENAVVLGSAATQQHNASTPDWPSQVISSSATRKALTFFVYRDDDFGTPTGANHTVLLSQSGPGINSFHAGIVNPPATSTTAGWDGFASDQDYSFALFDIQELPAYGIYENQLWDLIFNNDDSGFWSSLGTGVGQATTAQSLHVSLHTTLAGETASQTSNECTFSGYARVAVARSSAGWTITGNQVANTAAIAFTHTGGANQNVRFWGIGTDSTGAGNLLFSGPLALAESKVFAVDGAGVTGDHFVVPNHGYAVNEQVTFTDVEGDTLPVGIAEGTFYFIRSVTADRFDVSTSQGGNAVPLATVGSGKVARATARIIGNGDTITIGAGELVLTERAFSTP